MIKNKKYFTTIKGMYINQNKEHETFKIKKEKKVEI